MPPKIMTNRYHVFIRDTGSQYNFLILVSVIVSFLDLFQLQAAMYNHVHI